MDRNLRIRMLLEAGDKVSRPLRDIAGNSSRAARAIKEARDRLKQLEQAQADIGAFRTLKAGLRTTEAQLDGAKARVAELARQMAAADAPTKKLARDFDDAKRAAAALKLQFEQESRELQQLRERMQAAGLGANGLVAHERELRTELARTNREIEEQTRRLRAADERARRFGAARERFGRLQNTATGLAASGFSALSTGQAAARPVLGTVEAAQQYQSAMTDIAQKANLSRAAGEAMGRNLLAAARAANQIPADLQAGVDTLSGLGLDPRQATRMMAPIGRAATAYKAEIADLAAASFAVNDNLKVPVDQTARVIDVMAAAGKAGAFEMKDMAQYFPTLTAGYQALGQKGVGAVADLAAALQIARKGAGDSATAATNVANILQKINSPATVRAFKKNYGVDLPAALKKAYQEGKTPLEAIAELTQKVLKGDMSKLGYLFEDAQVQQGLRPLIANLEEYRRIRAEATSASGTTDRDFAERMRDSAEQTRQLKVNAQILAISLGSMLLPSVNRVTAMLTSFLSRANDWAKRNPALAKGAVLAAAGLAALFVVVGGGAIVIAGLIAPFAALSAMATALGIGLLPLIGIVGGVVVGAIALGAAIYYVYENWDGIVAWFGNLWSSIKSLFVQGVSWLISAFLNFSPQGLMLRGFMGLVAWLPTAWSWIKGAFSQGVMALARVLLAFNPTTLLASAFLALLGWLRGSMAGQMLNAGAALIQGLISGITGMLGRLKATIVNAATAAANWFKAKMGIHSPSRVFEGFGGYMMQGLDQGLVQGQREPISRINMLSREVAAALGVGAAATASPATAAPARAPVAASSAAAPIGKIEIHIHQQAGQSAQDLARAVRLEIERLENDRRAGRRSSMLDAPDGADA